MAEWGDYLRGFSNVQRDSAFAGINPEFGKRTASMFADAPDYVRTPTMLESLYRSPDDQARAIQSVAQRNGIPVTPGLMRSGIPGMAAPVGGSKHQSGTAADFNLEGASPEAKAWLYANAPGYGIKFPLKSTDAGHAELDDKFYGPVRPFDSTEPPGSSQARQPMSADASPQQPSPQQAPAMADYGAPQQQEDGGFLGNLTKSMRSPLFLTGASIFNQAYQPGGNVGAGIMGGLQASQQAASGDMQNLKMQREMQRQQQTDQFWGQLRDPNASPAWAKGLPPALLNIAGQLPPDQAASLITNHIQGTLKQSDPMYQAQLKKAQLEAEQPSEEWKVIGKDQYGSDRYGWVNRHTQTVREGQPQGGGGQQAEVPPGVTGDDYLKTLPPSIASQVKGIAEGRISYPGAFALKQPYWQRVVEGLSRYEPNADANLFKTRQATYKDFATGKMGQNVASFNTALGHMHDLYEQIDGLGNSDIPIANGPINAVRGALSDDAQSKLKTFDTTLSKVNAEVERAFKGSGATVHDLVEAKSAINKDMSPKAQKAAVVKLLDLMQSRIEAIGDQYNRGMGVAQPRAATSLLSPRSQEIVKKLKGEGAGHEGNYMVGAPQPAPAPSAAPVEGAKQAPDGHWYVPDQSRPGKFMMVR